MRGVVFHKEVPQGYTLVDLIRTLCERQPALSEYFEWTDNNEVCGTLKSVAVVHNQEVIMCIEDYRVKLKEEDTIQFIQGFSGG